MLKVLLIVAAVVLAVAIWRAVQRPQARQEVTEAPAIGSLEADRQTLRALQEAGADLSKETEVNFYLYFRDRAQAERAARGVSDSLFQSEVREAATGGGWLCLLTASMVPSETGIRSASTRFQAIADSLGGEYDGWEAAVTR